MPKLCIYENCRLRATNTNYCYIHKNLIREPEPEPEPTHICQTQTNLYKGLCRDCYLKKFCDDPMTFQMTFKNKIIATYQFIDNRFDGFTQFAASSKGAEHPTLFHSSNTNNRGILINNTLLLIVCSADTIPTTSLPPKYISVIFNTDKYKCPKTQKTVNPMLYTRLPLLEDIINQLFECILENTAKCLICPPFITINYHL